MESWFTVMREQSVAWSSGVLCFSFGSVCFETEGFLPANMHADFVDVGKDFSVAEHLVNAACSN